MRLYLRSATIHRKAARVTATLAGTPLHDPRNREPRALYQARIRPLFHVRAPLRHARTPGVRGAAVGRHHLAGDQGRTRRGQWRRRSGERPDLDIGSPVCVLCRGCGELDLCRARRHARLRPLHHAFCARQSPFPDPAGRPPCTRAGRAIPDRRDLPHHLPPDVRGRRPAQDFPGADLQFHRAGHGDRRAAPPRLCHGIHDADRAAILGAQACHRDLSGQPALEQPGHGAWLHALG